MLADCSLLERFVQLDGAASLALIDSGVTHCFEQQSKITNLCAMFESSQLKVQLATGHEFHTKKNCLLPIMFVLGIEHIVNCYIVDKLNTLIILSIQ